MARRVERLVEVQSGVLQHLTDYGARGVRRHRDAPAVVVRDNHRGRERLSGNLLRLGARLRRLPQGLHPRPVLGG
eukprot:CAMPEP_0198564716 /NCGR_PEP_ID=MMETSP1462-20131121/100677_1 /TAXON_ID=1333877 /ORGANISM="Brandtodinium nutriculum, Strain RCC3387" /LENGTH=74 /DNA_ID=CAMNT_0044295695 /DNA_START=9 /DNA_END=229 /DNA_ORIENTATION=-